MASPPATTPTTSPNSQNNPAPSPKKKKKKSWWSRAGDVVGDVASIPGKADRAVGHAISSFDRVTHLTGADRAVGKAIKGTTRAATAAASYPLQAAEGELRRGIRFGPELFYNDPRGKTVDQQTTLGQATADLAHGNRVDLGSGWFAAGEEAKKQAQASRDTLSVAGHAWTPGRALANVVVEPGTTPYRVLSGLVDAGVTWYGDPAARALGAASDARAAARSFSTITEDASVARAAAKAAPEWRTTIETAGGVSAGHRPTVVPAAVDEWLYSNDAKKVVNGLVAETSPSEIWRAMGKNVDPLVAQKLAGARTPEDVVAVLRPALGLDIAEAPKAGYFTHDLGSIGARVKNSAQMHLRALNVVPETWLPFDDPQTFVRNLDNSLANAKVMGEERRAILDQAINALAAGGQGSRKRLLNVASDAIKRSLIGYGVDEKLAQDMTSWAGNNERITHFLTDDAGKDVNFNFLLDADGNPITRPQPAAIVDLLNHGTFLHDPTEARKIRTLTSRLSPITTSPEFRWPHSIVAAFQSKVFKATNIPRPAFFTRVNSEEVVRSMASRQFNSVVDWLNFSASRRVLDAKSGMFDVVKEADTIAERLATETLDDATRAALRGRLAQINDELVQGKTAYQEAMSQRAWKHYDFSSAEKNMVRAGNWNIVEKGSQPFLWKHGLADETIAIAQDPVIKRVANGGLFEGDKVLNPRPGLDGIKDWLREGAGAKFRHKFEDAYPNVDFKDEAVLQDWIDKSQLRLSKLGDNPDLREAVATGRLNGEAIATATRGGPSVPSDALMNRLEQWRLDGRSPQFQKLEQVIDREGKIVSDSAEAAAFSRMFGEYFFGHLYGKTSDYLARSRVFRANYWNEMEKLTPFMDETARTEMLANAEKAGIGSGRLGRLRDAAATKAGTVDLEAADALAKGRALDFTKQLLYDASERSQFFDIARAVFPFGEAWKEVLGRWARLATTNPAVPRRLQQIVEGARGADPDGNGQGFFYRDPATGQEVFNYPLPGPLADYLGVNIKGSVQGLSIGTSVIPGVGPVAALGLDRILPDKPSTDFIRSIITPFGEPPSITDTIAPAWAKKLYTAGAAFFENPNGDRVYANTYMEVVRQLAASGDYGNTPAEKERLLRDAKPRAQAITALRGIMQAIVPSAPQISYLAKTKKGDVVAALLVKDLADMQAKDYDSAVGKFLDKYGDNAWAYLVGKTKSTVGGQRASTAYGNWERENGDLIRKYPKVAGYFAPQDEGFSQTVEQRQVKQGKRVSRTPSELIDDAQATLASWIYNQKKNQVQGRTDQAARDWLGGIKTQLLHDYPGWDPDAKPFNLPGQVRQLQSAATDPKVRDSELGQALDIYFTKRKQAIDSAKGAGLSSPFTAKKAAPLRTWLRGIGTELTKDYPSFGRVWDELLSREMKDDG